MTTTVPLPLNYIEDQNLIGNEQSIQLILAMHFELLFHPMQCEGQKQNCKDD